MIGYVTLGTNDFPRALGFYDQLLSIIDAKRAFDNGRLVMWASPKPGRPRLGVIKPHNGEAATPGNGTMVALSVDAPAVVDQLHAKALALGGVDEGKPGPRGGGFYGAYFRDLDGNKLCVFTMVKE